MGTDSNTYEEESAPVSGVAAPTGGSEVDWSGNNSDTWPAIWSEQCLQKLLSDPHYKEAYVKDGKSELALGWRKGVINLTEHLEKLGHQQNLLVPPTETKAYKKLEGELAALKALAGKVSPAYSQLQFFQDGYRNGSASISEVMRAGDDFHKTLDELSAALGEKTATKD